MIVSRELVRIASDGGRIGRPGGEVDEVGERVDVAVIGDAGAEDSRSQWQSHGDFNRATGE
jgi:hypothetical protein